MEFLILHSDRVMRCEAAVGFSISQQRNSLDERTDGQASEQASTDMLARTSRLIESKFFMLICNI